MLAPHPGYPNLRILDLTDTEDKKRLMLLLSDQYEWQSVEELDDRSLLQYRVIYHSPGAVIGNVITAPEFLQVPVRTVVVEFDYVDRDTSIAYVQLYARAFRDRPRRTVRLHFFSGQLETYSDFLPVKIATHIALCPHNASSLSTWVGHVSVQLALRSSSKTGMSQPVLVLLYGCPPTYLQGAGMTISLHARLLK